MCLYQILILLEINKYYHKVDHMKLKSSLKAAKQRGKGCQIVRRRGRMYVINKQNPRFKARQG